MRATPDLIVIAAGISAALHIGKLPPAIPVLEQALGIDLVTAGFLLSMVMLAGVTLGLILGTTAESVGLRRAMLSGLWLLSGASLLGGFATGAGQLLVLRALEGLGFLLIVLPAPGLIRRLIDPALLSRRLGLWSCYMGLGVGASLLVGPLWLEQLGWRSWWWLLGGLSLLLAIAVQRRIPTGIDRAPGLPPAWGRRIRRTLVHPGPWLVALTFGLYSGQWIAVVGFLPTLYSQAGFSSLMIGVLTALVALVNIAGNLLAGQLLHRGVAPPKLLSSGFAAMGLTAWLAFGVLTPGALQTLMALLFSALGGLIPGALFFLAVRLAPDEFTVSSTVGWMQQWSACGQFVGPPLVALMVGFRGHWEATWWVTGSMAAGGIVMALLLSRHTRRVGPETPTTRSPSS